MGLINLFFGRNDRLTFRFLDQKRFLQEFVESNQLLEGQYKITLKFFIINYIACIFILHTSFQRDVARH